MSELDRDKAIAQHLAAEDERLRLETLNRDTSVPPKHYREQRRPEYPSIGDQLDALYKARNGDTSDLEAIDSVISDIKSKYPK
jgi:hypothetical protein